MKYNSSNKPMVCMLTQSNCYKGTTKMTPIGVLWHSTGANNPWLKRYVQPSDKKPAEDTFNKKQWLEVLGTNRYNNDFNHIDRDAGLNCWIGKLANGNVTTIQTMPWNYKPWGCGSGSKGSCNNGWIQFEICEDGLTDRDYFNKVYQEACEITAYLCKLYGIDPNGSVKLNGVTVPTILCHADSHALKLGSNHGDVNHWLPKFGKSMATVRADVAKLIKEAASSTPSTPPDTPSQPTPTPASKKVRIGHASSSSTSSAATEVLIRYYYSSLNPTLVLRPTTSKLAEASASACEAGCNNNHIEYSQSQRNTLYSAAKDVDFDLAAIKNTCYADCSSFMTVCAIAGGAKISGASAPNCGTMRSVFTKNGDYLALTSSELLESSDYLRRGDILVRETTIDGSRHTVMVLDNGSKVTSYEDSSSSDIVDNSSPSVVIVDDTPIQQDIVITNMELAFSKIASTEASVLISINQIKNGTEYSHIASNNFECSYQLKALSDTSINESSGKITTSTDDAMLSLTSLVPDTTYSLRILARENLGDTEFTSNLIFYTPQTYPTAVRNLKVSYENNNSDCRITFDAPTSWGSTKLQRSYRLSFLVNNVETYFSIFQASTGSINKTISMTDLLNKTVLSHNDIVQVCIQPVLINNGEVIYDPSAASYSAPKQIKAFLNNVHRLYIQTEDAFKNIILYRR